MFLNLTHQHPKFKVFLQWLIIIGVLLFIFRVQILHTIFYVPYYVTYKPKTSNFKILLVWGNGVGERENVQRFKIAAQRLGVELRSASDMTAEFGFDRFVQHRTAIAAKAFKPNLIFIHERYIAPLRGFKNYLWLDQSEYNYRSFDLSKYDGLLPVFSDLTQFPRNYKFMFNWYPTIYKTEYHVQRPKRLFFLGGVITDGTRNSEKYQQVFSLLDKTGYLELHGTKERWQHAPNSLQPPIPFDGVSILQAANAAGVTLILHARDHLEHGLPTGRIFEAAAANTVIISDKNKFVLDNFGDNVLYVDVSQDAEDIFEQIDNHMRWIKANPQLAQQMADKCHRIVNEKFSLEEQLQRLIATQIQDSGTTT